MRPSWRLLNHNERAVHGRETENLESAPRQHSLPLHGTQSQTRSTCHCHAHRLQPAVKINNLQCGALDASVNLWAESAHAICGLRASYWYFVELNHLPGMGSETTCSTHGFSIYCECDSRRCSTIVDKPQERKQQRLAQSMQASNARS